MEIAPMSPRGHPVFHQPLRLEGRRVGERKRMRAGAEQVFEGPYNVSSLCSAGGPSSFEDGVDGALVCDVYSVDVKQGVEEPSGLAACFVGWRAGLRENGFFGPLVMGAYGLGIGFEPVVADVEQSAEFISRKAGCAVRRVVVGMSHFGLFRGLGGALTGSRRIFWCYP